jgi:ELWxxDGT repeat protein
VADDGSHGRELWKSDGTEDGTMMVKDIVPGVEGSEARQLVNAGDARLLLCLDDVIHGRELWVSDGTDEGTALVNDIRPGPEASGPRELVYVAA